AEHLDLRRRRGRGRVRGAGLRIRRDRRRRPGARGERGRGEGEDRGEAGEAHATRIPWRAPRRKRDVASVLRGRGPGLPPWDGSRWTARDPVHPYRHRSEARFPPKTGAAAALRRGRWSARGAV